MFEYEFPLHYVTLKFVLHCFVSLLLLLQILYLSVVNIYNFWGILLVLYIWIGRMYNSEKLFLFTCWTFKQRQISFLRIKYTYTIVKQLFSGIVTF